MDNPIRKDHDWKLISHLPLRNSRNKSDTNKLLLTASMVEYDLKGYQQVAIEREQSQVMESTEYN
uniref:Uncharacterized protein n=1 Tax=Solanum lycopersicum TaxID=4081 RepID=A0A3Q7GF31_SOLLC